MKKFTAIVSLAVALLLCLGTVGVFAASEASAVADGDTLYSDYYFADESVEEIFEEMLGEGAVKLLPVVMVAAVCMLLFIPALIVMIVFIVLNSKTKKKLREYERLYGDVPDGSRLYNPNNGQFGSAPFIPTNNYPPYNNGQQGGQF